MGAVMEDSSYSELYKMTDYNVSEVAQFAFGLVDRLKDADAAVDALLDKIGTMFKLDSIAVKEIVEDGQAIRCTYEWSPNGRKTLLDLERRFLQNVILEWENRYKQNKDGCYIYHKAEGSKPPVRLCKAAKVETLLQIPLYRCNELIGCIDFTDYSRVREWADNEIAALKNACRIMTSYMFGMRKTGAAREHLQELMSTDLITKLPTYEIFRHNVEESLKETDGMSLAIICADVVNFKYLNEKYGQEIGNLVLKVFAETVYDTFNTTVGCCREYSDNFVMAIKFPSDINEEAIRFRVDRMVFNYRNRLEERHASINVCINSGIFLMPEGYTDVRTAITNANFARKISRKMVGTNNISRSSVFHEDMVESKKKEQDYISRVQEAIDRKEFKVLLQPKVTCRDMRIVGAEALVRWQREDGSYIFPDEFIPAFERDGCIEKVDYFVYDTVFKYLHDRLEKGLPCVTISMNVSRFHLFSRHFISYIELLQSRYHVPPEYLEFELTENVYISDMPTVVYTLSKLKEMNIKISLDDFGSEFSSLEILTKLPFDIIKLDKVFMKDELKDTDKIIISCIIDMARKLNLTVLCEGVENEDQRRFLLESDCELLQGYLFSRPVDIPDFEKLLEKQVQ